MKLTVALLLSLSFLLSINAHAADAAAGKAKYDAICASCHGAVGKGDGPAAVALNPKPADLSMTTLDLAGVINIVKNGGPAVGKSPIMAGFGGTLSDAEIENVATYVKTLK